MIIKVCGIRDQDNYNQLSKSDIDMIGINFYPTSSRFIGDYKLSVKENQKRVGVFVAAAVETILDAQKNHHLDYAQLHGDEGCAYCKEIQQHIAIIKVFRITHDFDWSMLKAFDFADYFLFDTMTSKYGGSGKKFKWEDLDKYKMKVPFFLSGGIGPSDVKDIRTIQHPMLVGLDINSKFELSPALKDVVMVDKFIKEIRI